MTFVYFKQFSPLQLAVSRAFGDLELKDPPIVVSTPEITVRPIESTDQFVVLACDGVWDVLSDQEVIPCNLSPIVLPHGPDRNISTPPSPHSYFGLRSSCFTETPLTLSYLFKVVDLVKPLVKGPLKAAAGAVVQQAYARGSTDNISVIVVALE